MEIVAFNEQEIDITSVYFRSSPGKHRLQSFPKRMIYDGREYTFTEDSWLYRWIQQGRGLVKLFDVSDGQNRYRLRLDPSNRWTLIGVKAAG